MCYVNVRVFLLPLSSVEYERESQVVLGSSGKTPTTVLRRTPSRPPPRPRAPTPTLSRLVPSLTGDLSPAVSPCNLPVYSPGFPSYLDPANPIPIAVHYPLFFSFSSVRFGSLLAPPGKKYLRGPPHILGMLLRPVGQPLRLPRGPRARTMSASLCAVGVGRHCGPGRDAGVFLFHITPLAT